jgi:hypothetical protein
MTQPCRLLSVLPRDLLTASLQWLDAADLSSCGCLCRAFHEIMDNRRCVNTRSTNRTIII